MAIEYIPLPREATAILDRGPARLADLNRAAGLAGFGLSPQADVFFSHDNSWGGLLRVDYRSPAAQGLLFTPETPRSMFPEEAAIGSLYLRALYWDRVRLSLLDQSIGRVSPWKNLAVTPFMENGRGDGYLFGIYSDWRLNDLDYGALGANISIERMAPNVLNLGGRRDRETWKSFTPADLGISKETAAQTASAYWQVLNVYGETLRDAARDADLPPDLHGRISARLDTITNDVELWQVMLGLGLSGEKARPILEAIYRRWKGEVLRQGFSSPFYQAVDQLVNRLWQAVDEAREYNWDILCD